MGKKLGTGQRGCEKFRRAWHFTGQLLFSQRNLLKGVDQDENETGNHAIPRENKEAL